MSLLYCSCQADLGFRGRNQIGVLRLLPNMYTCGGMMMIRFIDCHASEPLSYLRYWYCVEVSITVVIEVFHMASLFWPHGVSNNMDLCVSIQIQVWSDCMLGRGERQGEGRYKGEEWGRLRNRENITQYIDNYWTSFWLPIGTRWEIKTKFDHLSVWNCVQRLFDVF